MWEVELFESGMEMDTVDVPSLPAVDDIICGDMRVVEVRDVDRDSRTAKVSIAWV